MDYDELVADIVKQVHVRYKDYVEYQESENLDVESFEEVAEQLLNDELDTAPFDGGTPYEAFHSDCLSKLNI